LESGILRDDILKAAMFDYRIFDKSVGSKSGLVGDALVVRQERGASVQLDAQGDLVLQLPAAREGGSFLGALIQEDFESLAESGLTYAAWLFDRIDPTQRLSHVVPVATVLGASYQTWRTRTQHGASPNSLSMRTGSELLGMRERVALVGGELDCKCWLALRCIWASRQLFLVRHLYFQTNSISHRFKDFISPIKRDGGVLALHGLSQASMILLRIA
jgi:hypothetical protein